MKSYASRYAFWAQDYTTRNKDFIALQAECDAQMLDILEGRKAGFCAGVFGDPSSIITREFEFGFSTTLSK